MCAYICTMKQEYINQIRAFNRFYTKILGVLNIYREKATNDNRMEFVKLTKHGEEVYHTLNMAANQSVEEIFAGLDESRLQEIVKSMKTIFSLMTNNK